MRILRDVARDLLFFRHILHSRHLGGIREAEPGFFPWNKVRPVHEAVRLRNPGKTQKPKDIQSDRLCLATRENSHDLLRMSTENARFIAHRFVADFPDQFMR